MTLKLRAPAGVHSGGMTVGGVFVEIVDGVATLSTAAQVAELMGSHGFTPWKPDDLGARMPAANDENDDPNEDLKEHDPDSTTGDEIFLGMVPKLPRPAVLAALQASGTAYTLPMAVDGLRAILADVVQRRIADRKAGKEIPPLETPDALKAAQVAAEANAKDSEPDRGPDAPKD